MKALALITEEYNTDAAQWQFDKVMAAIAYDIDLTIVFCNNGIKQLQLNPAWKCLNIYGIDSIYVVDEKARSSEDYLIKVNQVDMTELKLMISESQLIL